MTVFYNWTMCSSHRCLERNPEVFISEDSVHLRIGGTLAVQMLEWFSRSVGWSGVAGDTESCERVRDGNPMGDLRSLEIPESPPSARELIEKEIKKVE